MKIMIFEDTTFHREMAMCQLTGHELTFFSEFGEALHALNYGKEKFDVVLTDLMSQTFPHDLGRAQEQMPVGTSIALLALVKGVENVAIVSDANHHDHPGVHSTDGLCHQKIKGFNFQCLQDAVSFYDEKNLTEVERDYLHTDEGEQKYPQILDEARERVIGYRGIVRGKRWDWAMKQLFPEI